MPLAYIGLNVSGHSHGLIGLRIYLAKEQKMRVGIWLKVSSDFLEETGW